MKSYGMNEENKTRDELIYESLMLRKRIDELRAADIECKRIEDALRESEKRYRMLAETAHDFIFIIDSRGHIVYVNNFAANEFGCKPEDLIGKSIADVFPPETVAGQEKSLTLVFESGQPMNKEGKIQFPKREIWVNTWLVPLKDSEGAVQSIIGISRDMSSQKKAEKSLQENERFLSNVFSSIKDGICILDKDMNIVRVNPIMEEWYKHEMPLVGRKCYAVYHGRTQRCEICPSYKTLQTCKPAYEMVPKTGEGGRVVGQQDLYSFPMIDEATGQITGVIEYVRDITDHKRVEEQLQYRTKFEKLITTISTNFINLPPEKIDEGLNYALEALGQFAGVDRSYIFLLYENGTKITNTHEWCAEGIKHHIGSLQGLSFDSLPWFSRKMKDLETVHIQRISDMPDEARVEKAIFSSQEIKSLVNVPMVYKEQLVGFLGFDSVREEKVWSDDVISLLKIIGEIFINALEHKRSDEALRESEQQYRMTIDSLSAAIHVVDRELKIVLFNTTLKQWNVKMGLGELTIGRDLFEIYPFLTDKIRDEYKKVFVTGKTLITEEANRINNIEYITETRKIPIFEGREVVRVVTVMRDITEYKRAEKEREALNNEIIKTNKRLKQLALKDPHTTLYNYRYLGEVIEAEFDRARRYAHPISVIMIDIDYFKSINDLYGHEFGDLVLKQFALQLKSMVRRYDIVVRYGGEEFVIISAGTNKHKAFVQAQRLLDAINLYNFGNKKHSVKLKLSISVASYPDDNIAKGMDMISLADKILDKVKEEGGNRVYSFADINRKKSAEAQRSEEKPPDEVRFLKDKIVKLTRRGNQSVIEAIFAFAKTIELKDHYTGEHVEKTVRYATGIASALSLPKDEIESIRQAAALHDLGKIGIRENILLKASKLTREEFEEIKKHPQIGADVIRPIQFMHDIIPLILYHHERWDGKGYPAGLKGEEIPIGARIISIADAYHALSSDRPYRKAYSKKEARRIIQEGTGTQFDPKIASIFLKLIKNEK